MAANTSTTIEYLLLPENFNHPTAVYESIESALKGLGLAASDIPADAFPKMLEGAPDLCRGKQNSSRFAAASVILLLRAKGDGSLLGAMSINYDPRRKILTIENLCVSIEAKGKGKDLLDLAYLVAAGIGAVQTRLIVGVIGEHPEENKKLVNWYIKQGYNYEDEENKARGSLETPAMTRVVKATRRSSSRRGTRVQRRKSRKNRRGSN
jgi:hypothetical protein